MSRLITNGEIVLYGFVGATFWDEGFSSLEVLEALAAVGRDTDVLVRLNSGGGYAHEGVAIHNAFRAHKGKVTVQVDAIAASSASLLSMGADTIIMGKGSLMMIHDPSTIVMGTAADLEKAKNYLNTTAAQMAGIYADRSGDDEAAIRAEMKDELWLTASEAVERGFADSEGDGETATASAFEYGIYARAPEPLTALAKANGWSIKKEMGRSARATAKAAKAAKTPTENEDIDMTEAEKLALEASAKTSGATEAKARIKAIMTSADAAGREALANHFAYETEMTAEAAVAALKVAPVTAAAPEAQSDADKLAAMTTEQKAAAYEAARLSGQALPDGGAPKAKTGAVAWADFRANRAA